MPSARYERLIEKTNALLNEKILFGKHNRSNPLQNKYNGNLPNAMDDVILNYTKMYRLLDTSSDEHDGLELERLDEFLDDIVFIIDCANQIKVYGYVKG